MFKIKENRFLDDGIIIYTDESNNVLRMTKHGAGFRAKLRFADNHISTELIEVTDVNNCEGVTVKLSCPEGTELDTKPLMPTLKAAGEIIEIWTNMICDIQSLQMPVAFLNKMYPERSDEEINEYRILSLANYEELRDIISIL